MEQNNHPQHTATQIRDSQDCASTTSVDPGPLRLGRIVAVVRKQSGISQRQLARKAGLDIATLSRLEQGFYASPTPATLRCLSQALGIGLVELYRAAGYVAAEDLLHVADEIAASAGLSENVADHVRAKYLLYLADTHDAHLDQPAPA